MPLLRRVGLFVPSPLPTLPTALLGLGGSGLSSSIPHAKRKIKKEYLPLSHVPCPLKKEYLPLSHVPCPLSLFLYICTDPQRGVLIFSGLRKYPAETVSQNAVNRAPDQGNSCVGKLVYINR